MQEARWRAGRLDAWQHRYRPAHGGETVRNAHVARRPIRAPRSIKRPSDLATLDYNLPPWGHSVPNEGANYEEDSDDWLCGGYRGRNGSAGIGCDNRPRSDHLSFSRRVRR